MTEAALKLLREAEVEERKVLAYTKPEWWESCNENTYKGRTQLTIKNFILGKLKKTTTYGHRRWDAKGSHHIFTTRKNGSELWMYKNNPSIKVKICVAKKVNGIFLGNSSSLVFNKVPSTGQVKAFNGQRLKIQEIMQDVMTMVPFQLFEETKLDINSFKVVEKGRDEKLDIGRTIKGKKVLTHFMGAMVFKIGSKVYEDQYFLFDIDRNDLLLNNLNFFLSRLPKKVDSIEEAYASLKPKEVYDAERFLGKPCQRQGEWFFIPVQGDFKIKTEANWSGNGRPRHTNAVLQSKGNRAHYAQKLSEEGYVTGRIWHGGGEHKTIELDTWCKPVPNTAVESFKISGAID
jgi:hypothetical protein